MTDLNRIETIANAVMQEFLDTEILAHAAPEGEACEDQVECLVGSALNRKKAEIEIYTQARNFTSLQQYDDLLALFQQTDGEARSAISQSIKGLFSANSGEEFGESALDMMAPFVNTLKASTVETIAVLYVDLLGRKDLRAQYCTNLTAETEYAPDSFFGINNKKALAILEEQGLLEEWSALTQNPPAADIEQEQAISL